MLRQAHARPQCILGGFRHHPRLRSFLNIQTYLYIFLCQEVFPGHTENFLRPLLNRRTAEVRLHYLRPDKNLAARDGTTDGHDDRHHPICGNESRPPMRQGLVYPQAAIWIPAFICLSRAGGEMTCTASARQARAAERRRSATPRTPVPKIAGMESRRNPASCGFEARRWSPLPRFGRFEHVRREPVAQRVFADGTRIEKVQEKPRIAQPDSSRECPRDLAAAHR